jgi:hypothetical protein
MTALKTSLASVGYTLTTTYSKTSNKITFQSSPDVYVFNNENTIYEQLGFDVDSVVNLTGTPITSTNVCNLEPINNIYVRLEGLLCINSEEVADYNQSGFSNILAKVPINVNSNQVIDYEPFFPLEIVALAERINFLFFRLTDENGQLISLNGLHWQITLELSLV